MPAPATTVDTGIGLAEDLRLAVGRFVRAVRAEADTPTTAQAETLGLLDRDGAASIAALAQKRAVKHQSMRLVVGLLEAEGLVKRRPDPEDRRSHLVALTDAGRSAIAAARTRRAATIASLIDERLSPADRKVLREAIGLLNRMTGPAP